MSRKPLRKANSKKPVIKKKVQQTVNPHRHVLPMDEVPIDLGVALERRIDTRTNALMLGLDGGVGRGIDSGSDLNSIKPGEDDETDYESITDNNLLTQSSYISGMFQQSSVLHEDETMSAQHSHQSRTISNKIESDVIENIPANRREGEPLLFRPEKKSG